MLFTNRKTDVCSNRFGGDGDVIINHYIDEKMINDSIVMYAEVVLKPGCNLGYHQHTGNSETIVVLVPLSLYSAVPFKTTRVSLLPVCW